jgi:hypothetical protein
MTCSEAHELTSTVVILRTVFGEVRQARSPTYHRTLMQHSFMFANLQLLHREWSRSYVHKNRGMSHHSTRLSPYYNACGAHPCTKVILAFLVDSVHQALITQLRKSLVVHC